MSIPLSSSAKRHSMMALWQHYKAVIQATWSHRHELSGPARLADELAFLPAALSLQASPPHPAPRRVMWSIQVLFMLALLWSILGQVDIVAVAPGRIAISEGSKLLQPFETSVVTKIWVHNGDKVRQGQVLVELDPTSAKADSSRIAQESHAALSELWRTRALLASLASHRAPALPDAPDAGLPLLPAEELSLARSLLQAEWQDIKAQQDKLDADIEARKAELQTVREQVAKLVATLPLAQKREADFETLANQGFVSRHAGQDRTQARIEMEQDLATLRARREETKAAITQAQQSRSAWVADTLRALNDRQAKADLQFRQLQSEGLKSSQRERLTTLRAPVDGTVQQLAIHTTGGVVTPAQVLLVVVPTQAKVVAEVSLENKDVGFVRAGMPAEIKLETFPYTRYGTVSASVATITADAVMEARTGSDVKAPSTAAGGVATYQATLALTQPSIVVDGRTMALTPGMNLSAEIKTGQQRIIEYLLSPVRSHLGESLRER